MSYSIVIAIIAILAMFMLGMAYSFNLGLKLAEKGVQPVRVDIPKRKVKKSEEQIQREKDYNAFIDAIDNFHGRGSGGLE